MPAGRLLGTSSTSSPCIFCAFRAFEHAHCLSLPHRPPRRLLNTTRPPHQSATSAARVEAENVSDAPNSSQWNPDSDLTAAERAEKERRAQRFRQDEEARQKENRAKEHASEARRIESFKKREAQARQRERERQHIASLEKREEVARIREAEVREKLEARRGPRITIGRAGAAGYRDVSNKRSGPPPVDVSRPSFGASSQAAQPSFRKDFEDLDSPAFQPLQYRTGDEAQEVPTPREQQGRRPRKDLRNTPRVEYRLDLSGRSNDDASTAARENGHDIGDAEPQAPTDLHTPTPQNPEQHDSWQHLPRRTQRSEQPQTEQSPAKQSDDWIESSFAAHQRTRGTPAQPNGSSRATQSDDRFVVRSTLSTAERRVIRCARCLEYGHSARECTQPTKQTCHSCGQVGHLARYCPQRSAMQQGRKNFSDSQRSFESGTQSSVAGFRDGDSARRPSFRDAQTEVPSFDDRRRDASGRSQVSAPSFTVRTQESEGAEQDDRRLKRSRRGFADESEQAEMDAQEERSAGRRGGRRRQEREDDEAAEEAYALREERAARKAARKAAQKASRAAGRREGGVPITLPEFISVSNLAQTLNVHYDNFVERLEDLGYDDVFPGKVLNAETSGMIAMEYNFDPVFEDAAEKGEEEERDLKARPEVEDKSFLPSRPPVVTIMGHVDHGKTTILDYLRQSSVAAGEAGGITQHIGAFSVPLSGSGKSITFLDTPGHAAFLAMRQRGANITDIVILVVAADDSVKPQTLESLRCAREAGVPILVAINKIDKPEADVEKVKNDLARHGVEIEDFGGDTQVICVSGKTGKGMEDLEEATVTLSEILDHRAEADGPVEGWVVEATTKSSGRVATVLVKRGTLRPGAVVVAGNTWGRVRTLKNEAGQLVHEAGPGIPVEVDGWRFQPSAGDEVLQATNEQKAGDVIEYRREKEERERIAQDMEVINETRRLEQERRAREKAEEASKKTSGNTEADPTPSPTETASTEHKESGQLTVPFIIKADVSGSAEAVAAYIPSLTSPLIAPQILQSGIGPVHESDIEFAATVGGHIIAFNLPANNDAKAAAESKGVRILENNIIYRVLDDVKEVLEGKLPPLVTQRVLGEAEVSVSFDIDIGRRKRMWIAGCKVRNGVVGKGSRVRVLRGSEKVYDGTISSLKNVKKDVLEMRKGTECGIGFEMWEHFKVGDQVQTYEEVSEKRRL